MNVILLLGFSNSIQITIDEFNKDYIKHAKFKGLGVDYSNNQTAHFTMDFDEYSALRTALASAHD